MAKKMSDSQKERIARQFSKDENGRVVRVSNEVETKEERKERATSKRIIAICLWLVGIFFEVIGILRLKGVIEWIPSLSEMTFLIIVLVLDFIAVVIGSQLWKKANHIDPASEKNALKFWVQNNLGTIISVIAFLPIIIFIFTDKEMDKKNKTIVGVVAIILLLVAGVSSYDFNPVSSEQLERAQSEIKAITGDENSTVYWVKNSKVYHLDENCQHIKGKDQEHGTVAEAFEHGLSDPCKTCIKKVLDEMNDESDHDHEDEEEE